MQLAEEVSARVYVCVCVCVCVCVTHRHPASGYVQGMNDLVTPFMIVFLSEHLMGPLDTWQPDQLTQVGAHTHIHTHTRVQ